MHIARDCARVNPCTRKSSSPESASGARTLDGTPVTYAA
jgi:hypothetical protein